MMQAWGDWRGRVGPALADGGAPHRRSRPCRRLGRTPAYHRLQPFDADSPDAAKALYNGHTFLTGAPDDFSVDVYELTPIQM